MKSASQTAGPEQQRILQLAFETFSNVLDTISFDKLKEIVQNFETFNYFSGAIQLLLSYAAALYVKVYYFF